ncbi:MAG: membrane protein insertase YidC [Gemmatimonadaceae bacterium]|nr:membrane protein insertase YidC [Gemmatimonadaceae bacterium]
MDKRTILALALVALVIMITPKLFPTSMTKGRAKPVAGTTDSSQSGAAVAAPSGQASVPPGSTIGPSAPAAPTLAATSTDSTGPVKPESTTVTSAVADYVFSNQGAAPMSVRLPSYRALDKVNENVTITSGNGRSLISYRVLGATDTLALASVSFTLERSTASSGATVLDYRGSANGRALSLKYTIVPDSFLARVEGSVGVDANGQPARFVLIDLPNTFHSFEADSLDDQNHFAFALKPRGRGAEGVPFGKLDPGERHLVQGPLVWAAAKSKYFIVGVLGSEGDDSFAEAVTVGGPRTTKRATSATGTVVTRLNNGTFRFELYTGPQQYKRLQALGREFENSNPYGGWLQGVVQPFATVVMKILLWMRATLKLDYGWLLVIFGIAVRLILWPLNHGAMRTSMRMQRIQPELNDIQKRYKADPQKMQSEMMRVYKEHDMSPFSTFAGCLPMLLPMPVLFALFFVFQNTIEFRGVPFLWLADISIKDPYYIVPLLMGVSMFLLSWIGMRNSPPNPQAKMMLYIFPVMMTFLFANFASGLNLYYAIQNIAALPQQWLIANERGKLGGGGGKKG